MVSDAQAEVKKAEGAKVKTGTTVEEKIAAHKERQARIDAAKARLQKWQEIASTPVRRTQQAEAQEREQARAEKQKIVEEFNGNTSTEVDEYGNPFVKNSSGSIDFGTIESESGLPEAPIRLNRGDNKKDADGKNRGYGLLHIEAGHGEQIRNAGYGSVEEFVEKVARNYSVIREGEMIAGNQTYLLELVDEHNNTLYVQLSKDGQYWNVNSAGIFRKKYSRNKKEVYSLPAVSSSTNTDAEGVNRGQNNGATATSGNSPQTSSASKDSNSERITKAQHEELSEEGKSEAPKEPEKEADNPRGAASANSKVDTNPTEAQKRAGNYKKGHIKVDGHNVTIENPKGSVRSGKDANVKEWSIKMNYDYGYIRGTEGVDGDHIDVYLSDTPTEGNVYVVDQVNQNDGSFDEHKVMYGFSSIDESKAAYLSQYEDGWKVGTITEVSKEDFKKWIESSHRKTKPFKRYHINGYDQGKIAYDYAQYLLEAKKDNTSNAEAPAQEGQPQVVTDTQSVAPSHQQAQEYTIEPAEYTTKRGNVLSMQFVKFSRELTKEEYASAKNLAKELRGWYDREKGGFMMRSEADAKKLVDAIMDETGEKLADAAPISLSDVRQLTANQEAKPGTNKKTEDALASHGMKIGDKVLYKGKLATLTDVDYGRPVLDTGMAPVLYEQAEWEEITPVNEQPKNEGAIGLVSDERMNELKERLRRKLGGQLNVGIDPEVLAIGLELTAGYIDRGIKKFADYAKKMIAELGDIIRPYLKAFYNGARDLPEIIESGLSEEMTPYDEVSIFDVANFDKPSSNIFAKAEMVASEQEKLKQAEQANKDIANVRNDNRRQQEEQTAQTTENKPQNSLKNEDNIVSSQGEEQDLSNDFEGQKRWLELHKEELISAYIKKAGNKLDPDELRKSFSPIGYTGSNVGNFKKAGDLLRDEVFEIMIAKAIEQGNSTITYLTGIPGAGKSTATKEMDFSGQGVVFDSAFNSFNSLEKQIQAAIAKGIKPKDMTIVAVHNDPITAFSNTIARGLRTGRWVGIDYFTTDAFISNQNKIETLSNAYPDITIIPIDNSHNQRREVSVEDAILWDYDLTKEQITELLNLIYNGQENNRLEQTQVATLLGGSSTSTTLTSERVSAIAKILNDRVSENSRRILREAGGSERLERVGAELQYGLSEQSQDTNHNTQDNNGIQVQHLGHSSGRGSTGQQSHEDGALGETERVQSELGEEYDVQIANKKNAGDSYDTAVIVTKNGVKNFEESGALHEAAYTRFSIKEINERFNAELQQQIDGTLPKGHIYQLGRPLSILKSTGFSENNIEMSSKTLDEHSKDPKHAFDLNDVKDLPKAIQKPLAAFKYGKKEKAQNLILEVQQGGKNYLVGIHFNQERRGLVVSDIRGIFPKDNAEWLNWISQRKLLYANKEKIQALINQQRKTLAEVEYLDLDDIAKIINDFENPKLEEETLYLEASSSAPVSRRALQRQMSERVADLAQKLHLSNVEIVTSRDGLEGKRAKAKGIYTKSTGKITIVLPNNAGVADVAKQYELKVGEYARTAPSWQEKKKALSDVTKQKTLNSSVIAKKNSDWPSRAEAPGYVHNYSEKSATKEERISQRLKQLSENIPEKGVGAKMRKSVCLISEQCIQCALGWPVKQTFC